MQNLERMKELIQTISEANTAYYKYDAPIMADLEYDRLYDELADLERETGIILSPSPTQRVSGEVLESLTQRYGGIRLSDIPAFYLRKEVSLKWILESN